MAIGALMDSAYSKAKYTTAPRHATAFDDSAISVSYLLPNLMLNYFVDI